jgi:hypothetical protein
MTKIKKLYNYYNWGGRFLNDPYFKDTELLNKKEFQKQPFRYDIINFLLQQFNRESTYLEIGVRNPSDNFEKIKSTYKYSVDPGLEFKENPVDFRMTSDDFFYNLKNNEILTQNILFDVIFIDGLHLAEQVDRDIMNSLQFIKEDGFIVLHDCNPPTEWHAREEYSFDLTPARGAWNGTTWKAFYKHRFNETLTSCCVDSDFGVGILTKRNIFNRLTLNSNPFFEYKVLNLHRKEYLGIMTFSELQQKIMV